MVILRKACHSVAVLGAAAAIVVACTQAPSEPSVAALIDTLMTDLHERGLFNGAVVVGRNDEILYERGFGLANVAEGVPYTPNTPSDGASIGKTLTAAAILALHEDGRIDLDDPVTNYISEFPYPKITVRHLITHSSGLHPDGVYFTFLAPGVDTWTNKSLLQILVEHEPPLAFPPGSGFLYSGAAFNMAAILIERVTGTSYASFLRERIFDPLEMDSSFLPPPEASDWPGVRTHAYRRLDDGTLELADQPDNRQVYGQGRLYYSVRDLYRWVTSFYRNPVLSESALRAGLAPPILGAHPSGINLLNWYYPEAGRRYYFTGDSAHYTFAYWDADRRQAVVYMSNVFMPSWLKPRLAIALIDILEGRQPAPLSAPEYIELAPSILEAFPSLDDFASIPGVYETHSGARVSIENPPPSWMNVHWALEDGWFAPLARVDNGLRYNLFPVDNGILYVPGLDAWIGFTKGDDGPTIHWTTVFERTSAGTRKPQPADVAIRGATVVDVASGSLVPDQTVLIAGNRIEAVGPTDEVEIHSEATLIDGEGGYLIPGLWDMHVHSVREAATDWEETSIANVDWHFPLFLAHGVTGVRNMNDGTGDVTLALMTSVKRRLAESELLGPRLVASGPLVDGDPPLGANPVVVRTASEARATVDSLADAGADFIKPYENLSREAYFAILDQAQLRGIPVDGHLPFRITPEEAVRAGQRTIEHPEALAAGCSTQADVVREQFARVLADFHGLPEREQFLVQFRLYRAFYDSRDPAACATTIESFRRHGVAVAPDLVGYHHVVHAGEILADTTSMHLVPQAVRRNWEELVAEETTREFQSILQPIIPLELENVRLLNEAGVTLLAATDVGVPFQIPGLSLHRELGRLVEAGLTPLEALQAATINPARVLGLRDSLGTVEAGKFADLVLLDSNPLEDIGNTQRIRAVVADGRPYLRADIDQLLAEAAAPNQPFQARE